MEARSTNICSGLEPELDQALEKTRAVLLSLRTAEGIWTGELSASALSTATAVVALDLVRRHSTAVEPHLIDRIERGLRWLETIKSKSNISTTTLVWAALGLQKKCGVRSGECGMENRLHRPQEVILRAEKWLCDQAGGLEPERLAAKILERYGSDRTFSAPILTHCALAGRLGEGKGAWRQVIALPFELAACPPSWFGALRLPVVSYALPALVAIGYARHYHAPSANPFLRFLRSAVTDRVFRVLDSIQPDNGGFLEAIPLTSFVLMSLAGSGKADHPVARRALEFILNSAQLDGSWRIDTNLSTFVTTLAMQSLGTSGPNPVTTRGLDLLSEKERRTIQEWLLAQQYRVRHPYTNAPPGGWAWTPLPGGVPDADDTAGALLALKTLQLSSAEVTEAARLGVTWLMNLQNRDGGIPTFCRGWGKLPFDRSSADLTAHALRAWAAWEPDLDQPVRSRLAHSKTRAIEFLRRLQEPDGSWRPLWFGNQFEPDESNRVYGTSRVLLALAEIRSARECARLACGWLARTQTADGGWSGGAGNGPSTTEETALALEALCATAVNWPELQADLHLPIRRGLTHLLNRVADGSWTDPAPIGFYFAKLWYYEKLYPVIFTVAALERARFG
jgi:squalene-hopene/tetraprenyl-beta-curcumene cyclase